LARTQYWIRQHVFGIGLLWLRNKQIAAWLYVLVLLPGILLRELSRWIAAGMLGQRITFIIPKPEVDDDGIVRTNFLDYRTLNPVYIGIIAAAPAVVGFALMLAISYGVLNLPELLALLGNADSVALREAFSRLLGRADLPLWIYLLFTITNTMLPTVRELRSTWFLWLMFGGFMLFLLILGMYNAILLLLAGPIATAVYTLATVYGSVALVNLMMLVVISGVESIVSRLTNRRVEYRPAPPEPRRSALDAPRTVYDLRLPTPPPPSRALSAGAARKLSTGKIAEGELTAHATGAEGTDLPAARSEPVEPVVAPPRQRPTLILTPAQQTGQAARPLPPPPQLAKPLPPAPAKPLPITPPARSIAPSLTTEADQAADGEVVEKNDGSEWRYVPVDET
jgi:hypothetical protein